jgi:hypothetical protein
VQNVGRSLSLFLDEVLDGSIITLQETVHNLLGLVVIDVVKGHNLPVIFPARLFGLRHIMTAYSFATMFVPRHCIVEQVIVRTKTDKAGSPVGGKEKLQVMHGCWDGELSSPTFLHQVGPHTP